MATGFEQALLNIATRAAMKQAAARNVAEKKMTNAVNAAKAGALDNIAQANARIQQPQQPQQPPTIASPRQQQPSGMGYNLPKQPPANAVAGSVFQAPRGGSARLR